MKKEDCEGCHVYKYLPDENCRWFREDSTCPCSICLVKVMCTDSCQLIKDYINKEVKPRESIITKKLYIYSKKV